MARCDASRRGRTKTDVRRRSIPQPAAVRPPHVSSWGRGRRDTRARPPHNLLLPCQHMGKRGQEGERDGEVENEGERKGEKAKKEVEREGRETK